MRPLLLCLALLAGAVPAWGQTDSVVEAERARIAAERNQADARLASEEVACYKTFAVNDCLKAARSKRRERLSDLRRQELSLNEAERKRRAAERLRSIEERNAAQKQEDGAAQRAEAVARQREKQQAVAERAAARAKPAASATVRKPHAKPVHDGTDDRRRAQERQQQAKERQERVARRQAEAARSGVKPLPVPP